MTSSTQMQRNPLQQAGRAVAVVFSLVIIAVIAFFVIDEANARFGVMAVSISIVALTSDKGRMGKLGWAIDLGLMAAFLYSAIWFFKVKQDLYTGFFTATPDNIVAGLAGMMAILLLSMRAWGLSLALMAALFIGFGFVGPYLPGILEHFGMDLSGFLQISWYSFDGVFGRVTGLVADNVLIFLIFGAVLERTGAGDSLIHLSTALTARIRGGAAHAAIVASAIFGMMSGSVAANIAGTGVFTIPMIKRQGFSANFAGAVETAASSGGQLTPPIMAAAVFVMADLVGMPFVMVMAAAAIPALFKYIGLFAQVYTEAVRLDIQNLPESEIPKITARDWLNSALVFVPIGALMVAFIAGKSPAMAGLYGLLTAIVMGVILNPDFRREPRRIVSALADGGISAAQIMLAVGVIGIVLAVVNETGVAIRFATSIAAAGESSLILALILAMFGALILGMGLPTLPAYLIIAIMIAPAIIKAGVEPIAAHMFVLYFAVYSSIVPPIAYGCYVAAPIAGGNPLATSFVALRISVIGLLVPYVFVYSPSILLVADGFTWMEFVCTILRMLAAVWMLATAFGGADPRLGRIGAGQRLIRLVVGAAAMMPIAYFWIPAVIATVAVGLFSPKPKHNQPTGENLNV